MMKLQSSYSLRFSLVESCRVLWVVNHIAVYDWREVVVVGVIHVWGFLKLYWTGRPSLRCTNLKSGRSGEQYPFLLLLLVNDWILFRSVALAKPSQAHDDLILGVNWSCVQFTATYFSLIGFTHRELGRIAHELQFERCGYSHWYTHVRNVFSVQSSLVRVMWTRLCAVCF